MFSNVFKDTASTRAMAGIINTLEIEIITRRDTLTCQADKSALRMFIIARNAFVNTWNILVPDTDTVSYAIAWDTHLAASRFNNAKTEAIVTDYMNSILSDISDDLKSFLPHFSINTIQARENALTEIVNIDKTYTFAL